MDQYHDHETGLHYNRYRYYDSRVGLFISKDPISYAGGLNLYAYAPNPTGWVDPLGLSTKCLCGSGAVAIQPQAPRNANSVEGGPLENTTQVSGLFKIDGGPASCTVYRADNQGNITSYAVYDSKGMIVKRVDVTGAAYASVPTPHVIDYGRNKLPDGTVRAQSLSTKLAPRPATMDEVP